MTNESPYRFMAMSDAVAWDRRGHMYVNDRRVCCHTWWRRIAARLLRRHV